MPFFQLIEPIFFHLALENSPPKPEFQNLHRLGYLSGYTILRLLRSVSKAFEQKANRPNELNRLTFKKVSII